MIHDDFKNLKLGDQLSDGTTTIVTERLINEDSGFFTLNGNPIKVWWNDGKMVHQNNKPVFANEVTITKAKAA